MVPLLRWAPPGQPAPSRLRCVAIGGRDDTARRARRHPAPARSAPPPTHPQESADPPTGTAARGRTPTPTRNRTTSATTAHPPATPCPHSTATHRTDTRNRPASPTSNTRTHHRALYTTYRRSPCPGGRISGGSVPAESIGPASNPPRHKQHSHSNARRRRGRACTDGRRPQLQPTEKVMWPGSHFGDRGGRRIYHFLEPEHEGAGRQTKYARQTCTGQRRLVHTPLAEFRRSVDNFTRSASEVPSATPTTQAHQRGAAPPEVARRVPDAHRDERGQALPSGYQLYVPARPGRRGFHSDRAASAHPGLHCVSGSLWRVCHSGRDGFSFH